jgi:hypothetical protein
MIRAARIAFACLALAACGQPPATEQSAAAPEAAAATEANPGAITQEALLGSWGDNGDCTKLITFKADGTFDSYSGMSGNWTLNGDALTLSGSDGDFLLHVASGGPDTLMIGQPDGSFGISQRCPG